MVKVDAQPAQGRRSPSWLVRCINRGDLSRRSNPGIREWLVARLCPIGDWRLAIGTCSSLFFFLVFGFGATAYFFFYPVLPSSNNTVRLSSGGPFSSPPFLFRSTPPGEQKSRPSTPNQSIRFPNRYRKPLPMPIRKIPTSFFRYQMRVASSHVEIQLHYESQPRADPERRRGTR